jgi:streptogramin lyase
MTHRARAFTGAALLAVLLSILFACTSLGAVRTAASAPELLLPPETHADSVAIGPEGLPWYGAGGPAGGTLGQAPEALYHVTADGELATVPLPPQPPHRWGNIAVAWGPEGSLWFSREAADLTIGRMMPDGTITEFPVAPGEEHVGGLIVGPEGDAWFTLSTPGKVGRMTPGGTLTEYEVGPKSAPEGITATGGSIWFAEEHAEKIGRIDASGALALYPLGQRVHPRDVVADTGGSVWFSENGTARRRHGHVKRTDRIGRIDPAGQLHQIKIPFGLETRALFADPRGSIWFATAEGEISSISTTTEAIGARLCLPAGCKFPPEAFATAPDGALWWAVGTEQCGHCGGGTALLSDQQPGMLGSIAAEALAPGA